MELKKAVELNKESAESLRKGKFIDHADAVKLGIEALSHLIRLRACSVAFRNMRLPGEGA